MLLAAYDLESCLPGVAGGPGGIPGIFLAETQNEFWLLFLGLFLGWGGGHPAQLHLRRCPSVSLLDTLSSHSLLHNVLQNIPSSRSSPGSSEGYHFFLSHTMRCCCVKFESEETSPLGFLCASPYAVFTPKPMFVFLMKTCSLASSFLGSHSLLPSATA